VKKVVDSIGRPTEVRHLNDSELALIVGEPHASGMTQALAEEVLRLRQVTRDFLLDNTAQVDEVAELVAECRKRGATIEDFERENSRLLGALNDTRARLQEAEADRDRHSRRALQLSEQLDETRAARDAAKHALDEGMKRPRQPWGSDLKGIEWVRIGQVDGKGRDINNGHDLVFSLGDYGKCLVIQERAKPTCGKISPVNDRLFCQKTGKHVEHRVNADAGKTCVTWTD
jgi:hypothetical protein